MTEAQLWGFVQLVGLIFITSNCREIVANCLKYGWVVHWIPKTVINVQNHIALVVGTGMVVVLALISFWVEVRRGDQFCSSWAPAIKELQHIEYELQMRSKKHNIFNLHRELKGHYGRLSASGSVATDGPSGGNGPSVEGNSMVTPGILTALASDSERVNTPKTSDIKTAGDNSDATRMDAAGLDANTPEGVRDALECSRDLDLPPDRGRDAQKPQSVKIEETVKIQESMAVIAAPTGSATGALGKVARDRKKTADSDMTTVGGDLTGGSELKLSPVSGLRQRGRPGISDKQSVSPNINLDNAQSESSDDSIREAGRKRPAGGYRKRYIDPTRNFDISNVLSVAENYMRSQQKRINSIKNEVGDLMMKSPLVAVYNRLSMRVTERHVEFVHSIKAFVLCSLIFGVPYAIVLSTAFDPRKLLTKTNVAE
ncbi:putative transmembrane protein [Gregarina niphandrodes]|uniref:Transmembrane protein n=1 Tax=Gregarina niphandrodes TaxID=110365 RepID=A0A023B1J5_GRENI|nr:putative transmembrane protein [Gregarina niphandrodes]EZG46770.1 putative transmembrane protein [Gregarina niphandrodes]|eukprot:XP_011132279.1 putative transmembrane protein [Gregarina niphandrodes]